MTEKEINKLIKSEGIDTNLISDGYHTFGELYEFRKLYNAHLFNQWAKAPPPGIWAQLNWRWDRALESTNSLYQVHKSWKHYDGKLCFDGGWFIVTALLPSGQISNHYEAKDWDLFKIPETEKALFEFDGHTPQDVLKRLKDL